MSTDVESSRSRGVGCYMILRAPSARLFMPLRIAICPTPPPPPPTVYQVFAMNVSKVPFSVHFILCLVYNHLTKAYSATHSAHGELCGLATPSRLHGLPLMH
jgi:hypothetical protein